ADRLLGGPCGDGRGRGIAAVRPRREHRGRRSPVRPGSGVVAGGEEGLRFGRGSSTASARSTRVGPSRVSGSSKGGIMAEADPCATDLEALKQADYSRPKLLCDIVMKGGITSGVTYPWAVCELAQRYRLRNVGGTSAGAIAAATAAAAEVGRANAPGSADAGFPRLAGLPTRLSATTSGDKNSVLFNLFQPN